MLKMAASMETASTVVGLGTAPLSFVPKRLNLTLAGQRQTMSTTRITPSAAALSTTINHLTVWGMPTRILFTRRKNRAFTIFSKASDPLEVCAKESTTTPNRLGDCPFTQRVLLTLEEKGLPYDLKLVNFTNKPDWFLKISPEGKVPVVKIDEHWIPDSDVIAQVLEDKFPEPSLSTPVEKASVGSKILSTFVAFLKSKDSSDGTEQKLLSELTAFNDYIEKNGPFINGKEVSAADLSLGPKLYHLEIALGHYKNWSVPDSLTYLKSYMKSIFSLDSFVKTQALTEDVIEGWRPKVTG